MFEDKYKVLVVDDDPNVRNMIKDILENNSFTVLTAESGKVGLDVYYSVPDISLIISDMVMPGMDGKEFLREVRQIDNDIPFIVLTSNHEIKVALETMRIGANDYVLKGEQIDILLFSVRRVMEKYQLKKHNRKLMGALARKNKELEDSNNKLVELNKEKNKILGIAAHDLRSLASGVNQLGEILYGKLEGRMDDNEKVIFSTMNNTATGLVTLINDLLDLTVIESGKLDLRLERGSLRTLAENRIKMNDMFAKNKGMTIHSTLADTPETMFDPNRMGQIVDNIINNAVKFSPQGSNIYVDLTHDAAVITIAIRDEGPGISDEDKKRLFTEFQKLSAKPTAGEASTGLGLAIVKKMVEAHSGELSVESELGKGSTFYVKVPIRSEVEAECERV